MNPGVFNKRIKFIQVSSTQNEFGGAAPIETDILTTWGSLEPVRQYNQWAIEAGASVLNQDRILKIRYRESFQPSKSMLFIDESAPDTAYTIHAISPYWPGTKTGFEVADDKVYQDKRYLYIVGVKRG
jgi:SPP1 family predicted phage head-tail adaptor